MKTAIIIPARYASTRLPGKPLLAKTGKPLIQYTYEAALASVATQVIVATDDVRIKEAVEGFGGRVVMTQSDHETGTARVAEAAQGLDADIIVNLQGDEPEVLPETLNTLIGVHKKAIMRQPAAFASTLVCPFSPKPVTGPGSPDDPSCVKAVLSAEDDSGVRRALYFSRALVPYPRENDGVPCAPEEYFLHIGLYAFTSETVQAFARMPVSVLENVEKLEQLRILEAGHVLAVGIVEAAAPGIDTPEDYDAFIARQQTA